MKDITIIEQDRPGLLASIASAFCREKRIAYSRREIVKVAFARLWVSVKL